jgi:hypothetical protein
VAGCTIQDPTENTGGIKFVNDTGTRASLAYCSNDSCTASWWHDEVSPGRSTEDSVTAGRGNLAVIVVRQRDRVRCIRLTRWVDRVRVSLSSTIACHRPFE